MKESFILKQSIDHLESSVIITDADGVIEYVNPFFSRNTGYSFDECIGKTPKLISSGLHDHSYYEEMWATITSGDSWNGEFQNKKKNGELFWEKVYINVVLDDDGEIIQFIALYQDITEVKEARENLAQRERLLLNVEKISNIGGWEYDLKKDKIYWTDQLYAIHGFEKNPNIDFIKKSLECYHPEDALFIENSFKRAVEIGEGYDLVVRLFDINGHLKWVRVTTEALFDKDGSVSRVFGSVKDITEEYKKEQELEETKTRLEYALIGTNAGYWDWNLNDGKCIFNERWASMLGYNLEEIKPFNIETWESLTHPDDLRLAKVEHEKYLRGKIPIYEVVMRMKHKSGHWVWIFARGAIFGRDSNGNPSRMVGTHVDISERMNNSIKLEKSEKRYRTLFEKSSDPSIILENKVIKDCNNATVELLGYSSRNELIGMSIQDISPKEIKGVPITKVMEEQAEKFNERGYARMEWVHKRKDGSLVPVEISATIIPNYENFGKNLMYVVWRDITFKKKNELKLKDSQQRLKAITDNIEGAVHRYIEYDNGENIITYVSKGAKKLYGLSQEQILNDGAKLWRLIKVNDFNKVMSSMRQAAAELSIWDCKFRIKAENGSQKWLHAVGVPIRNSKDQYTVWDTIVTDVTEQAILQEKINNQLDEKTVLLGEIHHRVKNNLAIISGMLELQVFSTDNREVNDTLNRCLNRIKSFAIIHEQVYRTGDFTSIKINLSIESQIKYLSNKYKNQCEVKFDLDLEEVTVNVNQAIPFALFINESLMDAYIHSFKGIENPLIKLSLKQKEDCVHFTYQDNGQIVVADTDINNDYVLGQNLIDAFVKQLGGKLPTEYKPTLGRKISLKFKPSLKKGASLNSDIH